MCGGGGRVYSFTYFFYFLLFLQEFSLKYFANFHFPAMFFSPTLLNNSYDE